MLTVEITKKPTQENTEIKKHDTQWQILGVNIYTNQIPFPKTAA